MVPVKVPAARPVTRDATTIEAGVVPLVGETVSQEPPLAVAVKVVFGVALTERVCAAGDVPPTVAEKVSDAGVTVKVDDGLTVKETGTVVVSPLPVTVMVPVKVPAASPETLDETVRVAGVVPVAGETLNHGAPLTDAVKAAFGVALTERVCEGGDVPPAVAVNESVPGLTLNVEAGLTVKLTGTVRVVPPPVTVMVPEKVPADKPETTEDTVKVAGVVPVEGETLSQDPPLTVAVNAVLREALTERLCDDR